MIYPHISSMGDVLPHIEGHREFSIRHRDDYIVIDYDFCDENTFGELGNPSSHIRRECRGIKFAPNGLLISRPLHKFFNYGEKPKETVDTNHGKVFVIQEKLDGSMIHPCLIRGEIRWMTRAGLTDVSRQAEEFVKNKDNYTKIAKYCIDNGLTPIFEWCSPKNVIVINYSEDSLVLTAIRNNFTGKYGVTDNYANYFGIRTACTYTPDTRINLVNSWTDTEGIVVTYENGYKIKIKTDEYVKKHKFRSSLEQEKDMLSVVLNNNVDDMLPFLDKEMYKRVSTYRENMRLFLLDLELKVISALENFRDFDRKTIASTLDNPTYKGLKSIIFSSLNKSKEDISKIIKEYILRNSRTSTKIDELRINLDLPKWSRY